MKSMTLSIFSTHIFVNNAVVFRYATADITKNPLYNRLITLDFNGYHNALLAVICCFMFSYIVES